MENENEIVWQATITKEMVANLNHHEIGLLIEELDDVVASICEDYEVE